MLEEPDSHITEFTANTKSSRKKNVRSRRKTPAN